MTTHGYSVGQIVPASYTIGSDSYGGSAEILSERRIKFIEKNGHAILFSLRKDGRWREVGAKGGGTIYLGKSVDYMDPHF